MRSPAELVNFSSAGQLLDEIVCSMTISSNPSEDKVNMIVDRLSALLTPCQAGKLLQKLGQVSDLEGLATRHDLSLLL